MRSWDGALLFVALAAASTAVGAERIALLVGSGNGRMDQAPLRYTREDVGRMSSVLTELGGFQSEGVRHLDAERGEQVLEALRQLEKSPTRAELFLFYYSGHGDSAGLQFGETALPLEDLLAAIRRVPAEMKILLFDSCQSGAATRGKGVIAGAPINVRIDAALPRGEVIISSSSATEESFESDSLRGAVFTFHWVTGLRGVADEDSDGTITLAEAYRYARARTVSSTLLSRSGPQRPTFRWDFSGMREPILARAGASGRLTLQASRSGTFYVFGADEQSLFAEVRATKGEAPRVSLPAGRYVIRQRSESEVRSAQVELLTRDDRVLDDRQMEGARLVRLARKGGLGQWSAVADGGQLQTSLSSQTLLQVGAGAELERGTLLLGVGARFLLGSDHRNGLFVSQSGAGAHVDASWGLTLGGATLRAGPTVGAVVMQQQSTGRPAVLGTLAVLGVKSRLEVELTRQFSLLVGARAESWWGPARPPFAPFSWEVAENAGLFLSAGWSVGFRAPF